MNAESIKLHKTKKEYRKVAFTLSNVRYIIVHSTGTKPDMLLSELDILPYHYLITKAGKLLNLKPVSAKDGTVELALIGGLDKQGNRVDCRTPRQNETLFDTLVKLCECYPHAKIAAADKLYVYSHPNPGFDLQQWLASYVPDFLKAA